MQYKRTFITLKQENPNYALMGEAMGRCIIESRGGQGKVSFLVQNLKPEIIYKAYIISNIGSYGVMLGNLIIDSKGRGELKKIVNTYDVEETGMSLGDFEVAVILVSEKEEIISPLVGYVDREIKWKETFKEHKKTKDIAKEKTVEKKLDIVKEEVSEKKLETAKEEVPEERLQDIAVGEEAKEDIAEKINEVEEKEIVAANFKLEKEKIPNPKDFIEEQEDDNAKYKDFLDNPEDDSIHEVFKAMAQEVNKQITEFKYYTLMTEKNKEEVGKMEEVEEIEKLDIDTSEIKEYKIANELEYMFKNNLKMIPFKRQSRNVKWVRISLRETINLPMDFWNLINDPFVVSSFKKYNHLILGIFDERNEKEYMLGVPDLYKEENKSRANAMGFIQFKCCDDVKLEPNLHGYWIMPLTII